MDVVSLAAGALIGGVADDVYDKVKDKAGEVTKGELPEHGPIELHMLVDLVAGIEKVIREARLENCAPKYRKVVLSQSAPFELKRNGYRHVSLLTTTAFTANCMTEIGTVAFSMTAGWNAFDLPESTMVTINTGGPTIQSVILYHGDDSLDIAGV